MLCSALYAGCPAIIALRRGKSKGGDMGGGKFFCANGADSRKFAEFARFRHGILGEKYYSKIK